MPLATSLAWQLGDEQGEAQEGKIDIHLNSIFINGVKRRRIAELSQLPAHDAAGSLELNFNCGGKVQAKLLGGLPACTAFVEDCADILRRNSGKRKLSLVATALLTGADSASLQAPQKPAAAALIASTGQEVKHGDNGVDGGHAVATGALPEEHEPVDLSVSKAVSDGLAAALQALPASSSARPFLDELRTGLQRSAVVDAVVDASKSFEGQTALKEEKHSADMKTLRAEVSETKARCERLLRGRDSLEKQLRNVCSELGVLKEMN